jgi:NAD(P)-dependent dehydrogenase (short-subunit alcohol dehydrogenase family)
MKRVCIIGATRGLGRALVDLYASQPNTVVYGTARRDPPKEHTESVRWLSNIDVSRENAGTEILDQYGRDEPLDVLYVTAGYFATESFDKPKWEDEVKTYTISAIGPVFLIHHLVHGNVLKKGTKIVLISSEAGSIGLRHEKEGGGNFSHHASKAALNMVGKLLSMDLKDRGIVVSLVHPGFMRTDMTKGVGYDKYWDVGGAVTPDVAAKTLAEWTDKLDMSKTGQLWAPRGAKDIGTAGETMGPKDELPTPLQLPW